MIFQMNQLNNRKMDAISHHYMLALVAFDFSDLFICHAAQITLIKYLNPAPYIALK